MIRDMVHGAWYMPHATWSIGHGAHNLDALDWERRWPPHRTMLPCGEAYGLYIEPHTTNRAHDSSQGMSRDDAPSQDRVLVKDVGHHIDDGPLTGPCSCKGGGASHR